MESCNPPPYQTYSTVLTSEFYKCNWWFSNPGHTHKEVKTLRLLYQACDRGNCERTCEWELVESCLFLSLNKTGFGLDSKLEVVRRLMMYSC